MGRLSALSGQCPGAGSGTIMNTNDKSILRFAASTCAFIGQSLEDIASWALKEDATVELSSGFPYAPDLVERSKALRCKRLVHNYFPPPKDPFVLNLASLKPEVWNRSIEHARQAMDLSKAVGGSFYSVHAGFCADPAVSDLGKRFPIGSSADRKKYWASFMRAIELLIKEARDRGLSLFIENNVTITENVNAEGNSLLLCDAPAEVSEMLHNFKDDNFGVLLDTGHLNVSSHTLGFDPDEMVSAAAGRVGAIHHNDNDRKVDNNRPLTKDYWFLKHMPQHRGAFHILEVLNQTPGQVAEQRKLLEAAAQ